MEPFRIDTKKWPQLRDRLKREWPDLSEADLQFSEGGESDLVGRIERRLSGLDRGRITDRIKKLSIGIDINK
jgi:hypothetical protein